MLAILIICKHVFTCYLLSNLVTNVYSDCNNKLKTNFYFSN